MNSAGKTIRESDRVKDSSDKSGGAVRSTLPPRYTKIICIIHIALMIAIKILFLERPESRLSLSLRALKQLNTEVNIKSAKKAER